jgi:streptomycin 6-kinase
VESVRSDPSPQRVGWLASLPDLVAEYANRWLLDLEPPYQPGGRCAWVAPARDREGRDLVLKVAWRHDEAVHEADGLRAWAGDTLPTATRSGRCGRCATRGPLSSTGG